jgi:hypothetical protein
MTNGPRLSRPPRCREPTRRLQRRCSAPRSSIPDDRRQITAEIAHEAKLGVAGANPAGARVMEKPLKAVGL